MIGQDLAFTDGLYYSPGTAIHDVWAPELNPFNTIEMMEWQRIARHRRHLQKVKDHRGRTLYSDAQMTTYLQQFERDFADYRANGVRIIDATEGGVAKQHAEPMPLREVLDRFATRPLPALPKACRPLDARRMESGRARIRLVCEEVKAIRRVSRQTASLLRRMLDDQHDSPRMQRHFAMIESNRREIQKRMATFELLNHLNQLGVYKRVIADRKLHMQQDLSPLERQRLQLQRDLENVDWIADAASELVEQLGKADQLLGGRPVDLKSRSMTGSAGRSASPVSRESVRVAAMIGIDPHRSGLGVARSLAEPFAGRSTLQATLERLGRSRQIESIVLIAPAGFDLEPLIDRSGISVPVRIERCDGYPMPAYREAVSAARLWCDTSWRGGVGGMSIYDEILSPQIMIDVMNRLGLTAALVCGPDWPLIDVSRETGCDAVIARHRLHPREHKLVFTQAPPGLCGCVISEALMRELARGTRLSTNGALLSYQPHLPQGDPIARDCCVQIPAHMRHSHIRATSDHQRWRTLLRSACESIWTDHAPSSLFVEAIEERLHSIGFAQPQHVTIELTTRRSSSGALVESMRPHGPIDSMPADLAMALLDQLGGIDDCVVTFAGRGDPLEHEQCVEISRRAKAAGVKGVHVRTELRCDLRDIDELLDAGIDILSVDLHADRASTYTAMMGDDQFKSVLLNLERLREGQRKLSDLPGHAGFEMPWIVPRIQRRAETLDDIDSFFDRWMHLLGWAVIDAVPAQSNSDGDAGNECELLSTVTPGSAVRRERMRSMTILADGSVPNHEPFAISGDSIGNAGTRSIADLWALLVDARFGSVDRRARTREISHS
jgi:hypothetical protein